MHVCGFLQWNLSIKDLRNKDSSLIRILPVVPEEVGHTSLVTQLINIPHPHAGVDNTQGAGQDDANTMASGSTSWMLCRLVALGCLHS